MLVADGARGRADVDDAARALLAHDRQNRPHDVRHAVEVGRELPLELCGAQLLEVAEQAVARVVDQDVDAAERLHRLVDRRLRLGFVGDVQLDEREVLACDVAERVADLVEIASGRNHAVAGLQRSLGGGGADAAARARDEPDLAHV